VTADRESLPVLGRLGPPPEVVGVCGRHGQRSAHCGLCMADSLDEHDARHAYLDNDDQEVQACLWCQS
jgi:hypothetical protein